MIIYSITNLINGKKYIGLTSKGLAHRIRTHRNRINSQRGLNHPLYNAIKKNGIDNFKFEEIYSAFDLQELCEKEKYFIKLYNTTNRKYGYNLSDGGEFNRPSLEGLKRIGDKTKLRWSNPEYKERLINKLKTCDRKKGYLKGRTLPEEVKLKISNSRKGKCSGSDNYNYGKPGFMKGKTFSEEHKSKIAKALKGNKNTKTLGDHHNAKKIMCVDTGEIFNSISEAKLKYPKCNIYKAVSNGTRANKFLWKEL